MKEDINLNFENPKTQNNCIIIDRAQGRQK